MHKNNLRNVGGKKLFFHYTTFCNNIQYILKVYHILHCLAKYIAWLCEKATVYTRCIQTAKLLKRNLYIPANSLYSNITRVREKQ